MSFDCTDNWLPMIVFMQTFGCSSVPCSYIQCGNLRIGANIKESIEFWCSGSGVKMSANCVGEFGCGTLVGGCGWIPVGFDTVASGGERLWGWTGCTPDMICALLVPLLELYFGVIGVQRRAYWTSSESAINVISSLFSRLLCRGLGMVADARCAEGVTGGLPRRRLLVSSF